MARPGEEARRSLRDSGVDPDQPGGNRREWRTQAWIRAGEGLWEEALALQKAVVATGARSGGRDGIRDRFRLLRWEIAMGDWRGARDSVEAVIASLASRGSYSGPAIGWVFLARALLHLQAGSGGRFRQALAMVIRTARRERSRGLLAAALRIGAAVHRLAGDPQAPPGILARAWVRLAAGPAAGPAGDTRGAEGAAEAAAGPLHRGPDGEEEEWAGRFPALLAPPCAAPGALPGEMDWTRILPGVLEGPPAGAALRGPREPANLHDCGASDDRRRSILDEWLDQEERSPSRHLPAWLAPPLARLLEESAPDLDPKTRQRAYAAVSRLAGQSPEPWARAALLEALAETTLWLAAPSAGEAAPQETRRLLAQARADLGLAAGLYRRLGWEARAHRCEERWLRLTWPGLKPGVAEAARHAHGGSNRRGTLRWARQRLQDAGFYTADPRTLQELLPLLLLAPSPLPALILGESGTGKEVLARALHAWSGLRGDFVPIHCGAIPRDLLESELFGHTRGAFTGAATDKPGLVEAADGGTLFLDEIGEMGMEAQMKMLRVLESGEVRRLGDLKARRARIRLAAATHRNLEESITAGRFRLDLYHRIRGVAVTLPPLRERPLDIPALAARILRESNPEGEPLRLPESSLALLLGHSWPGNVRELKGVLLRARHLARALGSEALQPEFLGLGPATGHTGRPGAPASRTLEELEGRGPWPETPDRDLLEREGLDGILEGLERRLILQALERSQWNRTHAARALGGLSRTTLLSKMKRLGIADPASESR